MTELEILKKHHPEQTSSIVMLDVDRFKRINDTWGHQAGDQALTLISATLQELVGPVSLAGRIGGEEFAIFLAGDDGSEAVALAEAIRLAVEQIAFLPTPNLQETLPVSIGVACAKNTVPTARSFKHADSMLYQAKADGRNCVCVFTKLPASMQDGPLPLALERRV